MAFEASWCNPAALYNTCFWLEVFAFSLAAYLKGVVTYVCANILCKDMNTVTATCSYHSYLLQSLCSCPTGWALHLQAAWPACRQQLLLGKHAHYACLNAHQQAPRCQHCLDKAQGCMHEFGGLHAWGGQGCDDNDYDDSTRRAQRRVLDCGQVLCKTPCFKALLLLRNEWPGEDKERMCNQTTEMLPSQADMTNVYIVRSPEIILKQSFYTLNLEEKLAQHMTPIHAVPIANLFRHAYHRLYS